MKLFTTIVCVLLFYTFSFAQQLKVLVVDDDNFSSPDRLPTITNAITAAGHNFTVFDAAGTSTSPTATYMQTFDVVIWYAGIDGVGLMFWNGNDQVNPEIASYIVGGGKLWIIGTDLLYDYYGGAPVTFHAGDFAYDYLGLSSYSAQSYADDGGNGAPAMLKVSGQTLSSTDTLTFIFPTIWYADGVTGVIGTKNIYVFGYSNYTLYNKATAIYYGYQPTGVLGFYFDVYEVSPVSKINRIFQDVLTFFNQSAVPVELTSFTATRIDKNVSLNWETSTEVNNSGFEVERRIFTKNAAPEISSWENISFVKGNGTTTEQKSYSFVDKNVNVSDNYSYRLKQIDLDGNFKYSNEVLVTAITPRNFSLSQNYPNPFNPSTKIKFDVPFESFVSLKIYNSNGEELASPVNEIKTAGSYEVNFNTAGISSGVYFYILKAGNGYREIKKMTVLK